MASDGPPWVVGTNCSMTLAHPAVNLGEATGFYVKPDSWRVLLPKAWYRGSNLSALLPPGPLAAGRRVVELTVVSRGGLVHVDGAPSLLSGKDWHDALLAYLARVNEPVTLVGPDLVSRGLGVEEVEDRLSPLGGWWLLEWETRVVFVEV